MQCGIAPSLYFPKLVTVMRPVPRAYTGYIEAPLLHCNPELLISNFSFFPRQSFTFWKPRRVQGEETPIGRNRHVLVEISVQFSAKTGHTGSDIFVMKKNGSKISRVLKGQIRLKAANLFMYLFINEQ